MSSEQRAALDALLRQAPQPAERMRASYTAATTYNHTRDELRSFFGTWPLVPPGLALARSWRGGRADVPDPLDD
jgi:hypothetical protein